MKLKFQLSIAFVLSVIFLIGFSIMAFTISAYEFLNFDRTVISFVQGLESPFLTTIMKGFTFIGSSFSIIILFLLVLFYLYKVLKHRLELVLFSAVMVGSPLLNLILKLFFQRARPDLHRLIEIGGYSFPSGHAMNAFTLYGILTFLLWRHISTMWGRTLLILFSVMMILTIGISRIYLGVHYPSDIIGGYLASGCWLAISIWVFQKHKESQKNKEIN
ncbi:phosphatase PAP2 family protein [Peribacillus butanolivorans]|uniref:phosphatase PAP2 family protein n=1 Tax=Peribacillus butanolivorans TaxID=421767 RepID=UPI0036BA0D26